MYIGTGITNSMMGGGQRKFVVVGNWKMNGDKGCSSNSNSSHIHNYLNGSIGFTELKLLLIHTLTALSVTVYRVGLPISRKVLQIMFWEVPTADWLICSYLLPRQALATHVEKHNKTLRLIDSPALYFRCTLCAFWFREGLEASFK